MKKRLLLVMAVLVVVAIGVTIVVPASACCQGCTPGYWKNHTDAWPEGYLPTDSFDEKFGVDAPGDWTLEQALSLKNKDVGSGVMAAFMRHAVAALLNAAHSDVCYFHNEDGLIVDILANWGDEGFKDFLEGHNESDCPLN